MKPALLGLFLLAASPASAFRDNQAAVLDAGGGGLQDFKAWAKQKCPDCSLIFGSLIQGIIDAGYLKESACSWKQNVLRVELDTEHLYGEMASKSRVPIGWRLDKTVTFTFATEGAKTVVEAAGFGTLPPKQGLELYKAAMAASGLNGADCVDGDKCIKAETKAAGKYLKSNWKKLQKDLRKVTSVMETSYGKTAIWMLVSGKEWAKIFYSVITPVPVRFVRFTFEGGRVAATTEPDERMPSYPAYDEFHLFGKTQKMGLQSLSGASSSIAIATKFAASGMNFAKMMAYGAGPAFASVMEDMGVKAGEPKAVANFFSFCAGSTPGEDPSCEGNTPGRVAWSPEVPKAMV